MTHDEAKELLKLRELRKSVQAWADGLRDPKMTRASWMDLKRGMLAALEKCRE